MTGILDKIDNKQDTTSGAKDAYHLTTDPRKEMLYRDRTSVIDRLGLIEQTTDNKKKNNKDDNFDYRYRQMADNNKTN